MKKNSNLLKIIALGIFIAFPALFFSCSEEEEEPLPVAEFTTSVTPIVVGEYVTFQNQSQNATAYEWNFDNGFTTTDESPVVSFSAAGTYAVTLIVTGPGGTEQVSQDITVIEPTVMYMDADAPAVNSLNIASGAVSSAVNLDGEGFALAMDYETETLYYNDFDNLTLETNSLSGGNEQTILSDYVYSVFSIAVDSVNGKIYFPERDTSGVYMADLDGSNLTLLYGAEDGLESPTDVALDLENNRIYISDVGIDATNYAGDGIWQGNLDGSSLTKVITGGGYSLAVDPISDMLYYNDAFMDTNIKMAPLNDLENTSNFAALEYERCYGITVYGTKVYWSDLGADIGLGFIFRANIDGSNTEELANELGDPRHLVITK
ncbi:MAG: PKD domain-containing protein [Candidatus Cyclobacteriaceae bacterium M3_2C_046]